MNKSVWLWNEQIKDVNLNAAKTVYSDFADENLIYYLKRVSVIHDCASDVNVIIGIESDGVKYPIVNQNATTGVTYAMSTLIDTFLKSGDRVYVDIPAFTSGKYIQFMLRGIKIDSDAFSKSVAVMFL